MKLTEWRLKQVNENKQLICCVNKLIDRIMSCVV